MRYHIIYSVFCMMLYAARGSGHLIGEVIDTSKFGDLPVDGSGEYTRKTVDLTKAEIFQDSKWKVHSSRTLFSISSLSPDAGNKKISGQKSIRDYNTSISTNTSSMNDLPGSAISSNIHNDRRRNVENAIEDDLIEEINENLIEDPTGSSSSSSQSRQQNFEKPEGLNGKEMSRVRAAKQAEVNKKEALGKNKQNNDLKRNVLGRKPGANVSRRNIQESNYLSAQAPKDSYVLDNYVPGQSLHFHGKFKRGFQLVPLPRNVYVLKEDMNSPGDRPLLPGYSSRHSINGPSHLAPSYRSVGHYRPRLSRDRTSAMLSFKAHMHHDVKNIGNNFRRKISDRNLRFVNSGNSPIDSVDPWNSPDDSGISRSSSFGSPDLLLDNSEDDVKASNYQNFVDPSLDKLSNDVLDAENGQIYGRNDPVMAAPSYLDSSSSLQNRNPDSPLFVNSFEDNYLPYDKWNIPDSRNPVYRESNDDTSVYQSPVASGKYSWMENSDYNEPRDIFNGADNLGRDVRQSYDDRSTSKYSLKYLDRYAKALSSMDDNDSNNLKDISSQLDYQNGAVNDFEEHREMADSVNVDDPSAQPQESLDDIEKELSSHNDNSLKTRDISSLDDNQVEPALSPSNLLTKLNSNEERSFSNVIAPLQSQLQNILSTIKLVNENLTKQGNGEQRTDKETQNKREISSNERSRRKRHHEVLGDNSDEIEGNIDEHYSERIKKPEHEEKRFIDYSQVMIKPDGRSKKEKQYFSSSNNSEPQTQDAIKLAESRVSTNTTVTDMTQGTKHKRNPGIIDFIEKAFGMGTQNHRWVTEAAVTEFVEAEMDVDDTGSFSVTKEGHFSGGGGLTGNSKSFTDAVMTDGIEMKQGIAEKTIHNAEIQQKTTIPKPHKEKIASALITVAISSKTDYPLTGTTHEVTERPNDFNGNSEKIKPTIQPSISQDKSSSFPAIIIKTTLAAIIDLPTTSRNILSAHDNSSIVQSSRENHQLKESFSNNANYVAEPSTDTLSNQSSMISNFTETNNVFTPSSGSPLTNSPKVSQILPKPSHKLEDQRKAIDFLEVKKARESGVQDFLVKLLAPEVIRHITNDGVVVRIPSSSLSVRNDKKNSQPMVNSSEKVEIDEQKPNRTVAMVIRSHSSMPEIQTDNNYEFRNNTIPASLEMNISNAGNFSKPLNVRNNNASSTHRETSNTHQSTSKRKSKSKLKSIEDTAVVAISGDDTGGNARVDITLQIPIHKSQNDHEIVSRDSGDENSTRSEENENASEPIDAVNPIKRSAYEDYGEAEDYDEYLGYYDPDISEDYDLQKLDSPDAEEIYANAYLDALELQNNYEDDDEPEKLDQVSEPPLRNDLEMNEKRNHKTWKPYIWPEHFGQTFYSNLDSTDFSKNPSTPLYQLPKRLQVNHSGKNSRDNEKKSKIRPRRKKIKLTVNNKKMEGTTSLNSKKLSSVRLNRKLQSVSGFACSRKLFGFSDFDDDADKQLRTQTIEEFEMEQSNPLAMNLPNQEIAEVGDNPIDFDTTFEPEASVINVGEVDTEFDVTPSSKLSLSFLSPPIIPPPVVFGDNIDETEMFDKKIDTPEAMTEENTQSLFCNCAKTPASIDGIIASIATAEGPILMTEQTAEEAPELVLTTEEATEAISAEEETTPIVSITEEPFELTLTTNKTDDTTEKTTVTTLNSEGKRRTNKTTKKTTEIIRTTKEKIGKIESTEKNISKLKVNTKIEETKKTTAPSTLLRKVTTAEETSATFRITPTVSTISSTTLESTEITTTENAQTTKIDIIKTMTAPKTTGTSFSDLLIINPSKTTISVLESSRKSKWSTTLASRKPGEMLMITTLPVNLTSYIFSTTVLPKPLSRKTYKPKSETELKKKIKTKSTTPITSGMSRTEITEEPSSKTPKNTTVTDDQGSIELIIVTQNMTSKKTAKPRERRYRENDNEKQKLTIQPEIIVEITEETTGSDNSAATNISSQSVMTKKSTFMSTIVDDDEDEDYPETTTPKDLSSNALGLEPTNKEIKFSQDEIPVVDQGVKKVSGKEIGERAQRTTEVHTKLTEEYPIPTTPLLAVIRSEPYLERKISNTESTTEFDMLVTLPKILERPEEEPLTPWDSNVISTTISSPDNPEITPPLVERDFGSSNLSPSENDELSTVEEDDGSKTETSEKMTTDSGTTSDAGSLKRKNEKIQKPINDKKRLLEIRKKLMQRLTELRKKEKELKEREEDLQNKKEEVENLKTERENAQKKIQTEKLRKSTVKPFVSTQESTETELSNSIEESTETTESSVSFEESTETAESSISIEESTETTESSASLEESTQTTETSGALEESTETTESSVSLEESTGTAESSISIEESTETTESSVSLEESTDTTESSASLTESTETIESSDLIEELNTTRETESSINEIASTGTTEILSAASKKKGSKKPSSKIGKLTSTTKPSSTQGKATGSKKTSSKIGKLTSTTKPSSTQGKAAGSKKTSSKIGKLTSATQPFVTNEKTTDITETSSTTTDLTTFTEIEATESLTGEIEDMTSMTQTMISPEEIDEATESTIIETESTGTTETSGATGKKKGSKKPSSKIGKLTSTTKPSSTQGKATGSKKTSSKIGKLTSTTKPSSTQGKPMGSKKTSSKIGKLTSTTQRSETEETTTDITETSSTTGDLTTSMDIQATESLTSEMEDTTSATQTMISPEEIDETTESTITEIQSTGTTETSRATGKKKVSKKPSSKIGKLTSTTKPSSTQGKATGSKKTSSKIDKLTSTTKTSSTQGKPMGSKKTSSKIGKLTSTTQSSKTKGKTINTTETSSTTSDLTMSTKYQAIESLTGEIEDMTAITPKEIEKTTGSTITETGSTGTMETSSVTGKKKGSKKPSSKIGKLTSTTKPSSTKGKATGSKKTSGKISKLTSTTEGSKTKEKPTPTTATSSTGDDLTISTETQATETIIIEMEHTAFTAETMITSEKIEKTAESTITETESTGTTETLRVTGKKKGSKKPSSKIGKFTSTNKPSSTRGKVTGSKKTSSKIGKPTSTTKPSSTQGKAAGSKKTSSKIGNLTSTTQSFVTKEKTTDITETSSTTSDLTTSTEIEATESLTGEIEDMTSMTQTMISPEEIDETTESTITETESTGTTETSRATGKKKGSKKPSSKIGKLTSTTRPSSTQGKVTGSKKTSSKIDKLTSTTKPSSTQGKAAGSKKTSSKIGKLTSTTQSFVTKEKTTDITETSSTTSDLTTSTEIEATVSLTGEIETSSTDGDLTIPTEHQVTETLIINMKDKASSTKTLITPEEIEETTASTIGETEWTDGTTEPPSPASKEKGSKKTSSKIGKIPSTTRRSKIKGKTTGTIETSGGTGDLTMSTETQATESPIGELDDMTFTTQTVTAPEETKGTAESTTSETELTDGTSESPSSASKEKGSKKTSSKIGKLSSTTRRSKIKGKTTAMIETSGGTDDLTMSTETQTTESSIGELEYMTFTTKTVLDPEENKETIESTMTETESTGTTETSSATGKKKGSKKPPKKSSKSTSTTESPITETLSSIIEELEMTTEPLSTMDEWSIFEDMSDTTDGETVMAQLFSTTMNEPSMSLEEIETVSESTGPIEVMTGSSESSFTEEEETTTDNTLDLDEEALDKLSPEELEKKLEQLERQVDVKEKMIQEREKKLEHKENKLEKELTELKEEKELEKGGEEDKPEKEEDLEMVGESTTEGPSQPTEKWISTVSTEKPLEESSQPTPVPPVEETSRPIQSTTNKSEKKKKRKRKKCQPKKKPKISKSRTYVFDEDEEVWRKKRPEGYKRATIDPIPAEIYKRAVEKTTVQIGSEYLEEEELVNRVDQEKTDVQGVTKKVCLHILHDDHSLTDSQDVITEVVCPSYNPEIMKERGRKGYGRVARKLMDHDEGSSSQKLFQLEKNIGPDAEFSLGKRSPKKEPKHKKINHLNLQHHEWQNGESTPELHSPTGFTRLYELRSKNLGDAAIVVQKTKDKVRTNVKRGGEEFVNFHEEAMHDEFSDAEGDTENDESLHDREANEIDDVIKFKDFNDQDETKNSDLIRKGEDSLEVNETAILDDDYIEKQIKQIFPEYGAESETEDNSTYSKNTKTGSTVTVEEQKLIRLENQLLRKEAILRKKEDKINKQEKELMAGEILLKLNKPQISSHCSKIGKRKILGSDEETGSWKSRFDERNRMTRTKDWVRDIPNEEDESFGLKKKPFTVNVLRLEYDEDEESHKMKNVKPSQEETIVKISDQIESQHDDDEANDENLDDDSEVPCDDSDESTDEVEEKATTECSEDEEIIAPRSKATGKKSKTRKPPGSEWPTEKTSKYHVGGTMTWDEEFSTHPKELRRVRKVDIDEEDRNFDDYTKHVDNEEINKGAKRTMCYRGIVKKGNSGFRAKRKEKTENQIVRPMLTKFYHSLRWRSTDQTGRKTLQSENNSNILKRDVLGRKLSGFEEYPEREKLEIVNNRDELKSHRNKRNFLTSVEPNIRSKKSIECAEAEENLECNEGNGNDNYDDEVYNYKDAEETDDYYEDTDEDGNDFSKDEEDFSSITEDNSLLRKSDFDDIYSAPTEKINTSKRERMIDLTKTPQDSSSTSIVKQSRVVDNKNVIDSLFSNVTTGISDQNGFTQQKKLNSPQNLSLEVSNNTHGNIVTINPLFEKNNTTKSSSVFEPITLYTNAKNEKTMKSIITTKTPEKPIITIAADFQQNLTANGMMTKNPHPSHYHFSAEYADYEQDAKKEKNKQSISSFDRMEALRLPEEMEKKEMGGENIGSLENEKRLLKPESIMKNASLNAGHVESITKDAAANKTLPIFVRLDDVELFKLKNLPQPPAEIYVIYKCGPPMVVGEYRSTESSHQNELIITSSGVKKATKELTIGSVDEKCDESIKSSSVATDELSELINVRENLNAEVESARLDDKEVEFVPLCGRSAETDFGESLTSTIGKSTTVETLDASGVPGELSNGGPVTTAEQNISLTTITEVSLSSSSLTAEDTLDGNSTARTRVRAANAIGQREEIRPKLSKGETKFLDFSNVRKRQSPTKEFFPRKQREDKKPLKRSRTSRSLDSRLNSVENWEAEVKLEKKVTTTSKFRDEEIRRNIPSSYDELELDDFSNGSDLHYNDLETVDKTGRSLLGLDPFSERHENKLKTENDEESSKTRQETNRIISSGKKSENARNLKERVVRHSNEKPMTGETQAGFRRSPALDSGVLEEDDNPAETSSLLDKVMDMINPKDSSEKLSQENELSIDGMKDAGKEKKPRSLLERVKDIISNAIGLGKKDKSNKSMETMESSSINTTPLTSPDYREKSLLYDAEKMLASLTTPESNEPVEKIHDDFNSQKKSKQHSPKQDSRNKNSTGINKKKKSNTTSKKKTSSNKRSKEKHKKTSNIKDSTNIKPHGKLIFENKTKKVNVSEIIPRIRDLVEKQNLGSVEKIIVYVDKYEKNGNHRNITNPAKNLHPKALKKGLSKTRNSISKNDIEFRLNLKSPKLRKSLKNRKVNFNPAHHNTPHRRDVDESYAVFNDNTKNFDQLDSGNLMFDGLSFDTIISRVADEILKSVESNKNDSQNLGTEISVTVVQGVANSTESPLEKITTEFILDMFNQKPQSSSSFNEKDQKLVNNIEKPVNFHESRRLTSKVSKRQMNLPDVPRKNRRSNWKKKMKRDDEDEKKNRNRNLNIIRRRLLRELTRKLAAKRFRRFLNRSRLRRSLLRKKRGKSKSKSVPKNHDNLDEKIRIIYSMKRKNKNDRKTQKHRNYFENSKNRKHFWQDISLRNHEKNSTKHAAKRHKRDENLEDNEYFINGGKMGVEKILERNNDFQEDSTFVATSPQLGFHQPRNSIINNSEESKRTSDQESLETDTANEIPLKYDIANNDSIFYSHMLDLGKQLLNKSDFRSASFLMKGRNADLPKFSDDSKNLSEENYERMKNLVHAGTHFLLRHFEECENCKNELSPLEPNISSSLIKTKREDRGSVDVEKIAKKIINFATNIQSHHWEDKKARNVDGKAESLVEKFGIDELGLKSEKDKESLAALINEIVDVQKNVNETLEIIKTRSSNNEIKKIDAGRSIMNLTTAANEKKRRSKNDKKDRKKSSKKILSKKFEDKQQAGRKKRIESNEFNNIDKKVKKSVSRDVIEKNNSISKDKKKLESQSNREGHVDEIGEEIRSILMEENTLGLKEATLNGEKKNSNTSRKIRNIETMNDDFFPRYARDMDDTNIANFGKYRIRRVRSTAWDRAQLPSEDKEEMVFANYPKFLDLTNSDTNYNKNKKKNDMSEKPSLLSSSTVRPKFLSNVDNHSTFSKATGTRDPFEQISSTEQSRKITKKKKSEKFFNRSKNLKNNQKSKTKPKNFDKKHHHTKKKIKKPTNKMASSSKNSNKNISKQKKPTTLPSIHVDEALKWKLTGHVNFVAEPRDKEVNLNVPPSHVSVRRKLQSSPQMAGSKHLRGRSTTRKNKKSRKKRKIEKRSIKKNSKSIVNEEKVSRHDKKRESQTVIPMNNGHIRVKYIYRDVTEANQNQTKHEPEVPEITEEMKKIQNERKAVFTSVPVTEKQITKNNCASCICDLVETIEELKSILTARGDALMKILNYECPKYEEVGDKIVLFSTGIIGDILPRSRRDLAEAKGMTYIKPEDLEDVLRGGFKDEKNDNDLMSFPGNDLYIPCNRDDDDVTWLTSISKPNYTWIRDDGSPVSGFIRKNGNLELYDVDSKDSANYTCLVSYIDPDNEELVQNEYVHRIQVVTLPRYTLRGGNRYELENCDESVLDVLASHLPRKLNDILCKRSVCDAFIYAPRCYHKQISIRALIMPSSTAKLFPVGGSQCGLRCKKAVQDKIALMLSKNLQSILQKPIVFRLPHRSEDKLVPIANDLDKKKARNKRGRSNGNGDVDGQVGLLVGCPAGYGLRDSHCFPCSPGSHSDNMGSRCKKCSEGTYQPNTGARTCRSCTNPFVEGCYQMLWNSSSAVMAILVSLSAVITIFMILVWMLCCGKGKKSSTNESCARSTEIDLKYQQGAVDRSLRQPLIEPYRDLTEDDERWCDCEKLKKKKKRLLRKKLHSRDREGLEVLAHRPAEGTIESDRKVERVRIVPISCIDSYRSHGGGQSRNTYSKRYDFAKPPVPLPDFPR